MLLFACAFALLAISSDGCRPNVKTLGLDYLPLAYPLIYIGNYAAKKQFIPLQINGKIEILELSNDQENDQKLQNRVDNKAVSGNNNKGDIVFGRILGIPGSSAIGFFAEKSTEFWGHFIGQIQVPKTENDKATDTYIVDNADSYFDFFQRLASPGVHSLMYKLSNLKSSACHPIDNGRTDIGCDNPLQCSRGDDTDDLEEIEPSKKFVCKVRSIVDLRASIGFELRTTRPFEATANPRQIAALERMALRNIRRHITVLYAIANRINKIQGIAIKYEPTIEVYDRKKCQSDSSIYCRLDEPEHGNDDDENQERKFVHQLLGAVGSEEYSKGSGSCVTVLFTGLKLKFLQGSSYVGGVNKHRGACALKNDREQITENSAIINLFSDANLFAPLVENLSTLQHELGHAWGIAKHDEEAGCASGFVMTSNTIIDFSEEYLKYSSCSLKYFGKYKPIDSECPLEEKKEE